MAYYVDDKDIVKNIDINYIIDYFKNKGETCIRIMHSRGFSQPHGEKDYKLFDSLIIEPLKDKPSYVYQDGSRIISIDRKRSTICVNPYFDKSGSYDSDHSLSKNLQEYILDYKSTMRNNKINNIINEI